MYVCISLSIYMCVCVCVCVFMRIYRNDSGTPALLCDQVYTTTV